MSTPDESRIQAALEQLEKDECLEAILDEPYFTP
jgi:ribosome assembly protein YihI (activator of Der GTPase)